MTEKIRVDWPRIIFSGHPPPPHLDSIGFNPIFLNSVESNPVGRGRLETQMESGTSDQSRVDGKKGADRRELTAAERQALRRFKERTKANPAIRFKLTDDEQSFNLELDHSQKHICHPMLMKGLAATDKDFIEGIIDELINVYGMANERSLNFMLSLLNAIEPRDPLETMLSKRTNVVVHENR